MISCEVQVSAPKTIMDFFDLITVKFLLILI